MPRERYAADDPNEWFNRAESSLAHARGRSEEVYLEDLCFSAQQAAEKALKALLLRRVGQFPYIHDIGQLLRLLEESGEVVPGAVWNAKLLTDYAVETRYPGLFEPVTEEDYREAMELASRCVAWVRDRLSDTKLDM